MQADVGSLPIQLVIGARQNLHMNLELTRKLLSAAEEQPSGDFRVTGRDAAREVQLLADAGYVEACVDSGQGSPTEVIKSLTEAGEKLLRVLRQTSPGRT